MNWDVFETKYYMPVPGQPVRVILANPRMEYKRFKDSDTEKPHALFDVLRIGDKQFSSGEKMVSTGNRSLISQLHRAFDLEQKSIVFVEWWRDNNHNHSIVLLNPDGSARFRLEAFRC